MRAALIALAWSWLTLAALIVGAIALGFVVDWYSRRKSTAERASTVDRVDSYRERMAWEAQKAQAEWRMKQKKRQSARAKLQQLQHRKGGTPAA